MAQKKTTGTAKKPAAKKNTSKSKNTAKKPAQQPRRREIAAVVCLGIGVLSLLRYFPINDGQIIKAMSDFDKHMIGWGYIFVPFAFLAFAGILFFHHGRPVGWRVFSAAMLPVTFGALHHVFASDKTYAIGFEMVKDLWTDAMSVPCGGVIAGSIAEILRVLVSKAGAVVILVSAALIFAMIAFNISIVRIIEWYKNREKIEYVPDETPEGSEGKVLDFIADKTKRKEKPVETKKNNIAAYDLPVDDPILPVKETKKEKKQPLFNKNPGVVTPDQMYGEKPAPVPTDAELKKEEEAIAKAVAAEVAEELKQEAAIAAEIDSLPEIAANQQKLEDQLINMAAENAPTAGKTEKASKEDALAEYEKDIKAEEESKQYHFPPITLLEANPASYTYETADGDDPYKDRLEMALRSFGINSDITNIVRGPSVTRYEMELEVGVKLNKLTSLADDIALSLGASGVRIAAIPNKMSTVGIEVPNKKVNKVYLREIIESKNFQNAKSKLTFAIGKDIGGEPIIGDIAKLPHMLVAGTTGSGKSVCLNSLILSILYKARPDEVKFIMVDPKMVEFKIYNGIPHLHTPVVTEAKKASGALQWATVEMMKRYRLFSETGARDLATYNQQAERNEDIQKMPQIVVVIDELADLMMVAAKEVEDSIVRIAQMGRAAGIHLIIATQSPRAEIITGLMKANIPSRIALKVSSALESRIILDAGGNADKLVGNGDMLYVPVGTTKPIRVQGTWVSDEEREQIIEFIKSSSEIETVYSEEAIQYMDKAAEDKQTASNTKQADEADKDDQYDELLSKAIEVILDANQASVSMLQRRLKLGYARAARLVDQMEEKGIVGPFEGSKPRQILITKQQWQEMQFIQGTAPIPDAQQTMFTADDLFRQEEATTEEE